MSPSKIHPQNSLFSSNGHRTKNFRDLHFDKDLMAFDKIMEKLIYGLNRNFNFKINSSLIKMKTKQHNLFGAIHD